MKKTTKKNPLQPIVGGCKLGELRIIVAGVKTGRWINPNAADNVAGMLPKC